MAGTDRYVPAEPAHPSDPALIGYSKQVFDGMDLGVEDNDTRKIFERLESGEAVEEILRGIEGPYVLEGHSMKPY